MRLSFLISLVFIVQLSFAQSLPINFESDITTSDFIDFDGGTAFVNANPQPTGINTSASVAQIVRDGGEIWAGSKIDLAANLDWSTMNSISMKVYTSAPVGTIVKFKLEGNGTTERDIPTTVSEEWETLTWDFTGEPMNFNSIVFMFDFGNIGDGSISSTFYFDDIEQKFGGTQLDLPVNFDGNGINYTVSDFGGNQSSLVVDPTDASNMVIQSIKTDGAATWAGTTIGTEAGFATYIPLTLTDSKMNVRVWSPEANTPIRLKVEDHADPTHTCETETNTTVGGEWETLEFDFTNQAPGTELLSIGLSMGWQYNMASIFFNFGTEGAVAGEKTYYFDDVRFGEIVSSTSNPSKIKTTIFPNPSNDQWTIVSKDQKINRIRIIDFQGKLIEKIETKEDVVEINGASLATGIYIAEIISAKGTSIHKLIKQ